MAEAQSKKCDSCRWVYQKDSPAEVSYDKAGLVCCLHCHMVEKLLQRTKGKGTVIKIQQRCDRCNRDHSSDPESKPYWFCYDCSEFLCRQCEGKMHQGENKEVRYLSRHYHFMVQICCA